MKKIPFDAEKAKAGVPAYDNHGVQWNYYTASDHSDYPLVMEDGKGNRILFTLKGEYIISFPYPQMNLHMREEEVQYKKVPFNIDKARLGIPAYDTKGNEWVYTRSNGHPKYPLYMSSDVAEGEASFTLTGKFTLGEPDAWDLHMRVPVAEKSVAQRAAEGEPLETRSGKPVKFVAYEEGCKAPLVVRSGNRIMTRSEDGKMFSYGEAAGDVVIKETPKTTTVRLALAEAMEAKVVVTEKSALLLGMKVLGTKDVTLTEGEFVPGTKPN